MTGIIPFISSTTFVLGLIIKKKTLNSNSVPYISFVITYQFFTLFQKVMLKITIYIASKAFMDSIMRFDS